MSMPKPSGLELLEAEMAKQHDDAQASIASNGAMAARIAGSIRLGGRLLLVGMGASHYANRIAETEFRKLGVDAWAITAAELLQWRASEQSEATPSPSRAKARSTSPPNDGGEEGRPLSWLPSSPLPLGGGEVARALARDGEGAGSDLSGRGSESRTPTILLVSQSGESGEIVELLGQKPSDDWFGLTLDPSSTLGRAVPCLVGAGGGEVAFAATRSLLVTLALHAAVLAVLGGSDAAAGLHHPALPATAQALATLGEKTSIVVSGGGALRGLAEANALMLMELGRMPALGFEHGQFRHGPLELLSPEVGVLLLRGSGAEGAAVPGLARAVIGAGSVPVVFDCSGEAAILGAVTVAFPPSQGLAAAVLMLPALQRLIIGISGQKVERVGEPLRSTKITRAEP